MRVGTVTETDGRVEVTVNLDSLDSPSDLSIVIKNVGVDIDPDAPPNLDIDLHGAYRYLLEVYGPRRRALPGSVWFGSSSDNGEAGRRKIVVGREKLGGRRRSRPSCPTAQRITRFTDQSNGNIVDLTESRTVRSLQFQDSLQICDDECVHAITLTDGIFDVFPNATANVNANLVTADGVVLRKQNQGTLALNGTSPTIHVTDGALTGNFEIEGDLRVGSKGRLLIRETEFRETSMKVQEQLILDGTFVLDASHDVVLEARESRFGPSSVLVVTAAEPLEALGVETRRTILRSSIEVEAKTDLETFGFVKGGDEASSDITNHAGFGVFVNDITYHTDSVEAVLYQALAGDANGSGLFNSTDLYTGLYLRPLREKTSRLVDSGRLER